MPRWTIGRTCELHTGYNVDSSEGIKFHLNAFFVYSAKQDAPWLWPSSLLGPVENCMGFSKRMNLRQSIPYKLVEEALCRNLIQVREKKTENSKKSPRNQNPLRSQTSVTTLRPEQKEGWILHTAMAPNSRGLVSRNPVATRLPHQGCKPYSLMVMKDFAYKRKIQHTKETIPNQNWNLEGPEFAIAKRSWPWTPRESKKFWIERRKSGRRVLAELNWEPGTRALF